MRLCWLVSKRFVVEFHLWAQSAAVQIGKPSANVLLMAAGPPPSRTPSSPPIGPRSRFSRIFAAPFSRLLSATVGTAGLSEASEPPALNVRLTTPRTRKLPSVPPVKSPSSMPKRDVHAFAAVREKQRFNL